jgi:hypothetical protein
MEIEVLDYRLYVTVHVDMCEYSERIITSFLDPCKNSNNVQKLSVTVQ